MYEMKAYDENYEAFLIAMGAPSVMVPMILRSYENMNVKATTEGVTIITETGE